MRDWKVGADTYVFSQRVNVRECIDLILHDIKTAGYQGVELMDYMFSEPSDRERIGKLLEKHNLPLVSAYYAARMWVKEEQAQILEDAKRLADDVSALGGRYLVLSYPRKQDGERTEADYKVQAETLSAIGQICNERGLSATFHCYNFHVENGEKEVKEILGRVPEELLKLGPDLDWVLRGGVQPDDFVRRYGRRMNYMHLRDSKGGRWVEALGEGEVDFAGIARALDDVAFKGWIVVELAFERDFQETRPIAESLRLSREHIKKTMDV